MCHPLCDNVLKLNEDVNMSELIHAGLFLCTNISMQFCSGVMLYVDKNINFALFVCRTSDPFFFSIGF